MYFRLPGISGLFEIPASRGETAENPGNQILLFLPNKHIQFTGF
jgi:hypothetical protein